MILLWSCEDDYIIQTPEVKYKTGDAITWRSKNIDDSGWSLYRGNTKDSIFWARATIDILEKPKPFIPQGMLIYGFGAYEVYWDETLIGSNGTPGNELEKIGEIDRSFIIPDSLAKKGTHLLALRMSQKYHPEKQRGLGFVVGDYKNIIQAPVVLTAITYIFAGAFLLTALYFFILYFNNRRFFPVLLFSICSFLFSLLIIIEYIKFYIPIHYSDFYVRLEIIGALTFIIAFIIPIYFSIQFSIPKRKLIATIYFFLLLFLFFYYRGEYDFTTQVLILCMWFVSIAMAITAMVQKREHAFIVLSTLLINVIFYYYFEYDIGLILSFTILLLCMFYILAQQIKKQREVYEYSLVETSRLKNELLKKKIQPHFLMNTLTSLIDWVEESPRKGVYFIEALAEEFDLLNQIEDKKLIPISQEIQLCKSFLNIMKYRKEITYSWHEEAIEETQTIPPAIIHTLIENGITHCIPDTNNTISFQLVQETSSRHRRYFLRTIAGIRKPNKATEDGTGNKYVKARLTESYGQKWDFSSQKHPQGWENIITIYV
ncbi:histidine kinase [Aquimarina sp. D1M17]|uniref:histidine kinase n=1 Tax=Aquimarina acroporae TaxID=2937283 RepID=UPI0020C12E23|nr:sensor histidine kinase [Aquimarina acroporae]MCK8523291.1 histidine kinase [Aquimarina acroporae]